MSAAPTVIIEHTKKWLSTLVIGYGFCPFAKAEFESGSIHYALIETADLQAQLEALISHCAALDTDETRETTLLIFPKGLSGFDAYLELVGLAEDLLNLQGYNGIYQLASFHPHYIFADVPAEDPSHYTNRSPYPMLHILREASIEAVLKTYPNPENIPERNIRLTQKIGVESLKNLLNACYE